MRVSDFVWFSTSKFYEPTLWWPTYYRSIQEGPGSILAAASYLLALK
jgi:hypothetical protein